MIASASKLGWRVPSAFAFINRAGLVLDLHNVYPAEIGAHAAVDLATVEAAESILARRIGGPPNLEPLSDYQN